MVTLSRFWSAAVVSASLFVGVSPAEAQAPGLYYSWRSINTDTVGCIDRATTALNTQELENIQVEGNSISGTTENATAVFVCLEDADTTTVMIMVSSVDDENAFALRESLKGAF
ncbi:MAG: hypothetical protein F6J95_012280 [Leptolyngbya sp. SIO1E4]|nr:hypothetical protein [Leptolyngbya sp. SIO1E4]